MTCAILSEIKVPSLDTLSWNHARQLADHAGSSFFLFDEERFKENFTRLRTAFLTYYPDVQIGYSFKTNYTPHLCRTIDSLGGYAEVVSSMEYGLAKKLGIPDSKIIFNGPYKEHEAFTRAALGGATLNLDSHRDLELLEALDLKGCAQDISVVLRCNFALSPEDTSRFGFDVEASEFNDIIARVRAMPRVSVKGLHCHFPDRDLESFRHRACQMVNLVLRHFPNSLPEVLNIGGGYFSTIPPKIAATLGAKPASFEDYAALIGPILREGLAGRGRLPTLFLEPGTAVVADCFHFVTEVLSTKVIRDRSFASVSGSIFDISPMARVRTLPLRALHREQTKKGSRGPWQIVGYTCIEKDILSEDFDAPLRPGDFIQFSNVGSYSIVMRPPFILPANPIISINDGRAMQIRARQTMEDVFATFQF